jgi:AMMECR1 domain-containing protein
LPEVAKEQEWDQHSTLNYLVRKAGFNGKWDMVKDTLKVVRYQSIKIFMSFEEYTELKNSKLNL